jgi:hypothetical protein
MKKEFIFLVFTLLITGVTPGLAQEKYSANADSEIKKQMTKALEKRLEVTVTFKGGTILKGQVKEITEDTFTLQQPETSFVGIVNYADVASVKVQNQFLKIMKKAGKYAGKTAWVAAGIPVAIVATPVLLLLGLLGHPVCDC